MAEQFEGRVASLIGDRDHSMILGGISLALELCKVETTRIIPAFRRSLVPTLVRLLQGLISNTFSLEYDVGGINDPFLQVQILKLMRVLGKGDYEASDSMSDVLTHLTASIDGNRNVGQAVLYEALVTILGIRADSSLRTMAVNVLGRLLSNHTDNNIRYVSLNLLVKFVATDGGETVQRHRETVLECLNDPDVSIRRRAVEVALALVNRVTISGIVQQLASSILTRSAGSEDVSELAAYVITRLSILSARYAPSGKWYVDTMKYLLGCVDTSMASKEEIVSTFIRIVNNTNDIHEYATKRLYEETSSKSSEALIQATAWCLGEYGNLLDKESPSRIIESLINWSKLSLSSSALTYIITALGKLTLRFEPHMASIQQPLKTLTGSPNHEIAQKAIETLAFTQTASLRSLLFAPIPADAQYALGSATPNLPPSMTESNVLAENDRASSPAPAMDIFAELAMLSLDGLSSKTSSPTTNAPPAGTPPTLISSEDPDAIVKLPAIALLPTAFGAAPFI